MGNRRPALQASVRVAGRVSGLPAACWKYSPKVPVPPVFSVLNDSCDREWTGEALDAIAKAMKMWDGDGGQALLDAGRLKSYKAKGKEPLGKTRWLTFDALFAVAGYTKDDDARTTMRRLLQLKEPIEELPSAAERAEAAEERAATAKKAQAAAEKARLEAAKESAKSKDAHRKLKAYSKEHKTKVTEARKEERKKAKIAAKEALVDALRKKSAAEKVYVADFLTPDPLGTIDSRGSIIWVDEFARHAAEVDKQFN